MPTLITLADIQSAAARISGIATITPLIPLTLPSTFNLPYTIYLKDESAQPIGSFKLRGAYNKIAQLTPDQLRRGVITYSSGNHAQGVAYSARALNAKAVIVMPSNTPPNKLEATRNLGAEIVLVGPSSTERKLKAEQLAASHGYTIVPPYDDDAIIAGQATCGLEILEQLPTVDLVLSPVSGGGLLSGVATAIKLFAAEQMRVPPISRTWRSGNGAAEPSGQPQVYGVEPALSADAKESFDTRTLIEWPAAQTTRTLADGLRTQSLGQRNFEHILQHVDGIVTVSEEEIRTALRLILQTTSLVAEPSGAVTLAAALFHAHQLPPAKQIVAILSGGNLEPTLRAELESESLTPHV